MSSLADLPELVGFFSYSRQDDQHSQGALSALRTRIHSELRLQLGRDLRLWQDTAAIPEGSLWEDELKRAIAEFAFFIPIVTPSAVGSKHCRFEFDSFLKREAELGRRNLIFPLLYIRVPALEKEEQWRQDGVLKIVGARQYIDWQKIRHRSLSEPQVAEKIEQYCQNIVEILREAWVSPEERRKELENQQTAEKERQDKEDQKQKRQRAEREQFTRAAEERRRNEEEASLIRTTQEKVAGVQKVAISAASEQKLIPTDGSPLTTRLIQFGSKEIFRRLMGSILIVLGVLQIGFFAFSSNINFIDYFGANGYLLNFPDIGYTQQLTMLTGLFGAITISVGAGLIVGLQRHWKIIGLVASGASIFFNFLCLRTMWDYSALYDFVFLAALIALTVCFIGLLRSKFGPMLTLLSERRR